MSCAQFAKKGVVTPQWRYLEGEKINLLCMQETEINKNLDYNLLSFPGYSRETENSSSTSRVAIYVNKRIDYVRSRDLGLEGIESSWTWLEITILE